MKYIKRYVRHLQKFLETRFVSNLIEKTIWKYKHFYRPRWANTSINSYQIKQRHKFVSSIASFENIESVLEIGCAAGPNLRLLREKLPEAKLTGVDINKKCIERGNRYFQSVNDNNATLYPKSTDQLEFFKDKTFDIVCTQGVLLLLPPNKIRKAIADIVRLSKKGIILHEYNKDNATDGFFDNGRWVYDYPAILREFLNNPTIEISSSSFEGGSWTTYGRIIRISF